MSFPAIVPESALQSNYMSYLDALRASGFSGDIEISYGSRLAVATDNSVYQQIPQAVVLPRTNEDVALIGRLAAQYPDVTFSARGGGTGTNGQSLTKGIVVDVSRHMNQVLEINPEEGWARVQAGLVKDAFNDALRPHGYFFSPDLSTSNRATLGGMINTDASGQGSLVYGKTSDHVLSLTSVLANGEILNTEPLSVEDARKRSQQNDTYGNILRQVIASCVDKRQEILAKFPRLNRFLTGYDLEHAYDEDNQLIDVSRLLTGSEGSLAMIVEAKVSLTRIPQHRALVNIKYDSFESALRHAPRMIAANATSVETVDSKVLNLAKSDIVWHSIADLITDVPNKSMQGLNMVEYNSEDEQEIVSRIARLEEELTAAAEQGSDGVIGYQVTFDRGDILKIYGMRKKAVGLLGKTDGKQKPVAFAEDTAVPPEKLADFIMEFRALLDAHGLHYGMFGHVDAGVLHVRPALDLLDPAQEQLMHRISDEVVALVAKYGGLMWGEHGKGYRSEYAPAFFGESLFTELRRIKAVFDPHNQMNPGKICTPFGSDAQLVKVSDTKRASYDRTIPVALQEPFEPAMSCNGNGLCFNYDTSSPMCPSSKLTKDRRHSPKGRAGLIREWLRLLAKQGIDGDILASNAFKTSWLTRWRNSRSQHADFSHEVLEAMNGCLACKSCSKQCPVGVDVPDFRAKFLSVYYQRYARPLKDYLVANIERTAPWMAKFPRLFNLLATNPVTGKLVEKTIGYVDLPRLSVPPLPKRIASHVQHFDLAELSQLSDAAKARKVLIVQDPFTSFYEAELIADTVELIEKLGYEPVLLPFHPNGKPEHVKGFLQQFEHTASTTATFLNRVAELGIPMLGVDASLVLCYRDEYSKTLGAKRGAFNVLNMHEWLSALPDTAWQQKADCANQPSLALFAHCTEKTALPAVEKDWQAIFAKVNQAVEIVSVGCCGMAGTYGHEAEQKQNSLTLFSLSWQQALSKFNPSQVMASGYSCRSQVQRINAFKPKHPLQSLLACLRDK